MDVQALANHIGDYRAFSLNNGLDVRLSDVTFGEKHLCVQVQLSANGQSLPFNNPWIIVNPPLVDGEGSTDPSDVLVFIMQSSGFFDG